MWVDSSVLGTLAVVDIIVRTVRPRNLRYQARLQEISQGIAKGKFPPTYAAGYLEDLDFSSEQLDQLVHAFDNLPPSVQSSLVTSRILTSEQLATSRLCKHSVESSVVATLLKKYPHAFSAAQLDAWIRGFPSSHNVVLTIASLHRIEYAWWQPYLQGGLLSDELSRRIKAEIEYAKRPSRSSVFLIAHSRPLSYLLATPVFLGLAYWYLTYPGRPVVSVPIGDTLAAVLSSILIGLFGLLMFMTIFFIASASLGTILRAIGNWVENRSKGKIGSNLA